MEELQRSLGEGEGATFVSSRHCLYPVTPPVARRDGEPPTPPPTPHGDLSLSSALQPPVFPHINKEK